MLLDILSVLGCFVFTCDFLDISDSIRETMRRENELKKQYEEQQLREKFEQFYLEMQEKKGDVKNEEM